MDSSEPSSGSSSKMPVQPVSSGLPSDPQGQRKSDASDDLDAKVAALEQLALALKDDPLELLRLLRRLEQLHRSIQDGPFLASLPCGRNELFRLLEDMENSGGWPYIPRLQLRTFIDLLQVPPALAAVEPLPSS
jgi:hypothetical protein